MNQRRKADADPMFGFKAPFSAWVHDDDVVFLSDARGAHVAVFNTHTLLPLADKKALKQECDGWLRMASFMADAMNTAARGRAP